MARPTSRASLSVEDIRRRADAQDCASQERIARQWDTIDTLMAYLEEKGKTADFAKWQEKPANRKTRHHNDWKKAHPDGC